MSHNEMLGKIEGRFETREEAEAWYWTRALPGLSGLTAANLVQQGRAEELIDYLAAVDAGMHA